MSILAARVKDFVGNRVLCIGDVMLDRYVYGAVDRISPEAPIAVLSAKRKTKTLGGAGNVVRNIAALGSSFEMISVIGRDDAGEELKAIFDALPGSKTRLFIDETRPTTEKVRYVAGGQQLLRADHESAEAISTALEDQIIRAAQESLQECSVVILSDYAKGVLTAKVVKEVIAAARAAGKIIIVDPKYRDFGRYAGATYLTPNRKELSDAVGHSIDSVTDAETASRGLIADKGAENILAKLGADGICLVRKDQPAQHFHAKAREVFDVSGAGDTVAATFAVALAAGFAPDEAAELANIAGSVVVSKIGTATVSRDEIIRELSESAPHMGNDKIVGLGEAADIAERWRKQGLRVGFTNGFFDLLHPGQISLLRQARAACDRLIVGLNSDASVKRLKGPTRPVQGEDARAMVLSSLTDVDQVVIFDQDTPLETIKALRPDVLVKGGDYAIEGIVGAKEVKSWGGKVVLAQLLTGQSTTGMIAKIAET
jgi:D-beta-D-heptose 7-phosphate kinase/D-beta-D-heptose 1-phosphate adenosyltransferase